MVKNKSDLVKLICEAISEVSDEGGHYRDISSMENPEGVHGVDPGGEMGDEAREMEGEGEEDEAIRELNEIATSLLSVIKKLEGAQKKEK